MPILFGLVVMSLANCTSVESPDLMDLTAKSSATNEQVNETLEPIPTASDSIDYPEGAKTGGVLRFATGNGIVPDPAIGDDQTGADLDSHWLVYEIFSGLTKVDAERDNRVAPDLAQSFEVDPSGLRYEFTLRQDLKFSDGSPVTASDFKWSWERALHPRTSSPRAIEVLGQIDGANEIAKGLRSELSGVTVVDDRLLQITLVQPHSGFSAALADPVAFVLKRENVMNWGIQWGEAVNEFERPILSPENELPVGTGPFKLADADYQDGPWVLERNEHFWADKTFLDRIEIITEFSLLGFERWTELEEAAFVEGNIDMTYGYPEGVKSKTVPVEGAPQTSFLVFNSNQAPFDDVHFRRALVMSVDHHLFDHFSSTVFAAQGILPTGFPAFNEEIELLGYDPKSALEEYSSSEYFESGVEIRFEPLWDGFLAEEFQVLIESWQETLGVPASYSPLSNSEYKRKYDEGTLQVFGFEVEPDYPDPYAVFKGIADILKDDNISTEWALALKMLREATAEADSARRLQRFAELEQYLIDQALVLPMRWYTGENEYTFQPWVYGFDWPKYGGSKFQGVWFGDTAPDR